jgi:RNA-directed DNA polymerase
MAVIAKKLSTGAPSAMSSDWKDIEWPEIVAQVRRLQLRIAKAFREGKHGRAKALQWILTHSFYAKLLAVKRVVSNKGAKTPGLDNVTWKTSRQKMQAALSLKRRGYRTTPLKRIYIPKKQKGEVRPLSIPSMKCRGMQALHLFALEPIAETIADKNSYGFRPLRSTDDAIEQCFITLARKVSASYVLEGDICACFDSISHSWIVENTMMDKEILKKWLAAGYWDKGILYPTEIGTPQGGLASPTLLVITLSGLERAVKSAVEPRDKVNFVGYADDFIITGASKEILENKVKPVVETFLRERGLILSQHKTRITHINEGFDFLGMNVRKYKNKLIIKPARNGVNRFLVKIRKVIKKNATSKTEELIRQLNPKIRGWGNYYRHVCSKETFRLVDHSIFQALWKWAKRRHASDKNKAWIKMQYLRCNEQLRDWIFFAKTKNEQGEYYNLDLLSLSRIPIKRHVKVRAEATPFDPTYHQYFDKRISERKNETKSKRSGWWGKWWKLQKPKSRKQNVGPSKALQKV